MYSRCRSLLRHQRIVKTSSNNRIAHAALKANYFMSDGLSNWLKERVLV